MPVVKDAWDVGRDGLLDEADQERPEDPLALLLGISSASAGSMEGADGVGGGGWGWEGESLSQNEELDGRERDSERSSQQPARVAESKDR